MIDAFVVTVLGDVPLAQLGKVSMYEHVLCDLRHVYGTHSSDGAVETEALGDLRWNPMSLSENLTLDDPELIARELAAFREAGGQTVVEMTNRGMGQDVEGLAAVSAAAGVNIVASTGYYIGSSHPGDVAELSIDALAETLARDAVEGIGGTGIRAGMYGEIGTSSPLDEAEIKVLRAVARAHHVAERPISIHLDARGAHGLEVVQILEAEGIDPSGIILGHCDEHLDLNYHQALVRSGATISFDTFGTEVVYSSLGFSEPSDFQRMAALRELLEAVPEAANQVVLGQDVFLKQLLQRYGGMGYHHLLSRVVPALQEFFEFDVVTIETMLIHNPARLLAIPV